MSTERAPTSKIEIATKESVPRGFFYFGEVVSANEEGFSLKTKFQGSLSQLADEWITGSLFKEAFDKGSHCMLILNPEDMDIIEETPWYKEE